MKSGSSEPLSRADGLENLSRELENRLPSSELTSNEDPVPALHHLSSSTTGIVLVETLQGQDLTYSIRRQLFPEDPIVKVLFASSRKQIDNGFIEEVSDDLHYGEVTVKVNQGWREDGERVNDWAQYGTSAENGDSDRSDIAAGKHGAEKVFSMLTDETNEHDEGEKAKRAPVHTSVLVYIHGFQNSFEDSITRGAELAHKFSSDNHQLVPLVFSWPSGDELSTKAFKNAKDRARESGKLAAELYDHFVDLAVERFKQGQDNGGPCAEMYLIAHSMGVYVLRHLVQKVSANTTSLFRTAVLAAANEHRDTLGCEDGLLPLSDVAREVVVYSHRDDGVLNLGYFAGLFNYRDCLGLHGPSPATFQYYPGELSAVQCDTVIPSNYHSKHGYYHRCPRVVYDIRQVLDPERNSSDKVRRLRWVKDGIWRQGEKVYRLKPW